MKLNDFMSITELARLTGRTRPTLYKYVRDYEDGNYDDIPYTFLILMQMAEKPDVSRSELVEYCDKHYAKKTDKSPALRELIDFITNNCDKLDLKKIKEMIEKEIDE